MEGRDMNVKRWAELIRAEKLQDVLDEIRGHEVFQESSAVESDTKVNKGIFKLLLYLAHTADKCDKERHFTGKKIYELCFTFCSVLTRVPDDIKFISSLFHIIRCLLAMHMYQEAFEVSTFLRSTNVNRLDVNVSDILLKISYLWQHAANDAFVCVEKNSIASSKLETIMNFDLEVLRIVHKNYSKHFFTRISTYLDKMDRRDQGSFILSNKFCENIIERLRRAKVSLDVDAKYVIYRHMVHIVSRMTCQRIEGGRVEMEAPILTDAWNYFKNILAEDQECYECFKRFENVCGTLIKPLEHLTKHDSRDISDNIDGYFEIARKHGYSGAIKWTVLSTAQILEPLLAYWETSSKAGNKRFLDNGILLATMNAVSLIGIFFMKQVSEKCKSCYKESCTVRRDMYNAVVIKTRCVNLVSKLSQEDLSRDVCVLARKFLEQNIASIYEMKERDCKSWTSLWASCGTLIYNLGLISGNYYEEAKALFSLLFTCIIQFEGLNAVHRWINLPNPGCMALHRLSGVHYERSMYREAMTASALNGLLSYGDQNSKAFRMWANIKHKCASNKEIAELTMLRCLKADKSRIEELGLRLNMADYDLVELCLRETKGLQEAKVNLSSPIKEVLVDSERLDAAPVQQARMVQLLGHHLLSFEDESEILEILKRTISRLKQTECESAARRCLEANLEFYIFVDRSRLIGKETRLEMKKTKFALCAPRFSENGENESQSVVPAYSMINIKEDCRLMERLESSLRMWETCFRTSIEEIANGWEPALTLRTLVIAAEYSRLYRYEKCELGLWRLAFALATKLKDYRTIVYVTGRSISLRQFPSEWLAEAKEHCSRLSDTEDESTIEAIAIFWISLADLCFERGKHSEGRKLLDDARGLPGISFLRNTSVYLYSLDALLRNSRLYKERMEHKEYAFYMVEMLYAMVNLNEELTACKWKWQDRYLFGQDVLLSSTVSLAPRMNSLLSFREISAHLVRRLKVAQAGGLTMRVGEILKSLCHIDLSRGQLADCEVKLQGLERILDIESISVSMKARLPEGVPADGIGTPPRIIEPVRDVPRNDASPILRDKAFDLPEFLLHANCGCYRCQNATYRYLVLAATHIRAQVYALQNRIGTALEHFRGAFKISKILSEEKVDSLGRSRSAGGAKAGQWQDRFFVSDRVLLLLDFAHLLRNKVRSKREDAPKVALLAEKLCKAYQLEGHPIYTSALELIYDDRFRRAYPSVDYSAFTVPQPADLDISACASEEKQLPEPNSCATPTASPRSQARKPRPLRRNRTPPLLKLRKVSITFSDDEDNGTSPPAPRVQAKRATVRRRLTARAISTRDSLENPEDARPMGQGGMNGLADRMRALEVCGARGGTVAEASLPTARSRPDATPESGTFEPETAPGFSRGAPSLEKRARCSHQNRSSEALPSRASRQTASAATDDEGAADYGKATEGEGSPGRPRTRSAKRAILRTSTLNLRARKSKGKS
ncbi:hypothetical protein KM043_000981 [Ampulex compressa]|nr:hypothetical protein KM043_000981 [Ampulex compressa]